MKTLEQYTDPSYAILRIVTGALFTFHGLQKLFGVLTEHQPAFGTQLWFGGAIELICGLLIVIGCNNTPTVPIPPPEMTIVSSPGEDGYALVNGVPGSAQEGDVILVFNIDLQSGVICLAEADGSFQVEIEAEAGHILFVQIKRDNDLSDEEEFVVPEI